MCYTGKYIFELDRNRFHILNGEKNSLICLNLANIQNAHFEFFSKCVKFGTSLTHFENFHTALKW